MSYDVVEAGIAQLAAALARGEVTSAELVDAYLARIAAYDHAGPHLNSVVVLDPNARAEAEESDRRRTRGEPLGPLDGIPYTAKDSYSATGLTVAGGSPAFAHLVAQRDSYAVGRLRGAGAILLGLTNMPPMANGGMQRGLYGRAESPYNPAYLTAPFASGSSNGSGTATAASLAAFGLGEETWSSGRGPASNNGLCAYTPSRGVISIPGQLAAGADGPAVGAGRGRARRGSRGRPHRLPDRQQLRGRPARRCHHPHPRSRQPGLSRAGGPGSRRLVVGRLPPRQR